MVASPQIFAKGQASVPLQNSFLYALLMPVGFYTGSFYGLTGFSVAWVVVFPVPLLLISRKVLWTLGLSLAKYFTEIKHALVGSLVMLSVTRVAPCDDRRDERRPS